MEKKPVLRGEWALFVIYVPTPKVGSTILQSPPPEAGETICFLTACQKRGTHEIYLSHGEDLKDELAR